MTKRGIVVVFLLLTSMELIVISNSSLLHYDTINTTVLKMYSEDKSNSIKYKSPHIKTVCKQLIKQWD